MYIFIWLISVELLSNYPFDISDFGILHAQKSKHLPQVEKPPQFLVHAQQHIPKTQNATEQVQDRFPILGAQTQMDQFNLVRRVRNAGPVTTAWFPRKRGSWKKWIFKQWYTCAKNAVCGCYFCPHKNSIRSIVLHIRPKSKPSSFSLAMNNRYLTIDGGW